MKIKAVIFDLGETILNFGQLKASKLFREGARSSYDYLKSLNQPVGEFKSYCRRNLTAIRLNYWLSFFTKKDFNAMALLKKVNSKTNINLNDQQMEHLIWLWYEPLGRFAQIEPDIKQTLARLKDKSLKLGILSNTFINGCALEKHLAQFGILDFFETRLYSCDFDWRKPDIRIFEAAAEKIGEKCENIVFVGDRINKDIRPAKKLGMIPVLKDAYTNYSKRIPKDLLKIKHLSELPDLIEKMTQ